MSMKILQDHTECPEKITVFDTEHKEVASYVVPEQISGYEYEVESCMKAIQEGKLECPAARPPNQHAFL